MLLVGLTGGIGSGKSTVSAMLAERGAVIVDADEIARNLQSPKSPVLARMAERFGQHIIRDDGSLDRAAVAAIVFGDAPEARAALADLNGIVHPAMQDEIKRQISAQADTDRVVVLDFPLLTENPREGLAAWLQMGCRLGLLGSSGRGYELEGLAKTLALPRNDATLALLQEVAGLHHRLITETPAKLRAGEPWTLDDQDGELTARSSRALATR